MSSLQVLAGFHAVVARLRHAPASIKEIYVEASRRDKRMQTFIQQAQAANVKVLPVAAERLDGLSKGTRHQGVVALAEEHLNGKLPALRDINPGLPDWFCELIEPGGKLIWSGADQNIASFLPL